MKTLKELGGVKQLAKREQESITGGKYPCYDSQGRLICPKGQTCVDGVCGFSIE